MLPGAHRQVHERAKGWAIYWYAWRGGPQIGRFAGATLEEAEAAEIKGAAEIAKAYGAERRPKPADGTVAKVIATYLASPEWASLAFKTQQAWGPWLEKVREKWGHLSGEEFAGDAVVVEMGAWRDEIALKSPASADKAMEAVSRLCSYGRARTRHESIRLPKDCAPTKEIGRAYRRPVHLPPPRQEALDAVAALPELASIICDVALNSALRRSDLALISDPHVDVAAGVLRLGTKKGKRQRRIAAIRLTAPLLAAIRRAQAYRDALYARKVERSHQRGLPEPVKPLTILVNSRCRPWTADGIYQHIRSAFEEVQRERINPHSFRRAGATQRFLSGMSMAHLAREMGWSTDEAEVMAMTYVPNEALTGEG